MLNISPRSLEIGAPILGVKSSMKIGASHEIKSLNRRSEDAPVSKFRILGCKNKDMVGVVSIGILDSYLSLPILLNNMLLVSIFLVIGCFILVGIDMFSLFESITGISWVAPPEYWTSEDVGIVRLGISTFLRYELIAGGVGRL